MFQHKEWLLRLLASSRDKAIEFHSLWCKLTRKLPKCSWKKKQVRLLLSTVLGEIVICELSLTTRTTTLTNTCFKVKISLVATFICDCHSSTCEIQWIRDTLRSDTGQGSREKPSKMRIFWFVDLQQLSVLLKRRKLTCRIRNNSRECRRVSAIKC